MPSPASHPRGWAWPSGRTDDDDLHPGAAARRVRCQESGRQPLIRVTRLHRSGSPSCHAQMERRRLDSMNASALVSLDRSTQFSFRRTAAPLLTRLPASLLVALSLNACRPRLASPFVAECFALRWEDSVWASTLPQRVRLDPRRDTLLPPNYTRHHLLRPVEDADSARWAGLMNAWWLSNGADSVTLMLSSPDAHWTARMRRSGDSLAGLAVFSMAGEDGAPFFVYGRRFTCPDRPAAGA